MKVEDLKGKRIAILGFSVEGLSVARFLDRHGVSFTILEKEPLENLTEEAQAFVGSHAYPFISGSGHLKNLGKFQLVSRSQGIPLWLPEIAEARRRGTNFTSMTKLFFDFCPGQVIGVTGTKGKGTTATLIYEMLKASGQEVFLGGNIGPSPLDFMDKLRNESKVILELSSFQLEDLEKSPAVAVVLMVTQEHLDSQAPRSPNHHRSLEEYLEAKKRITRFQKDGDLAVVNHDFENSRLVGSAGRGKIYCFSLKEKVEPGAYLQEVWLAACLDKICLRICRREDVFLRGEHNLQNILAASLTALLLKAKFESVIEVARTFKGLEHRLELVRAVDGVKYYNDSFSTTPETTIAAIKAFVEPEVLILGGSEKGSDYTALAETINVAKNIRAVILIGATAARIEEAVLRAGGFGKSQLIEGLKTMNAVVSAAREVAKADEVVLLSPACASFDMFKNYKDRGQQFKEAVNKL